MPVTRRLTRDWSGPAAPAAQPPVVRPQEFWMPIKSYIVLLTSHWKAQESSMREALEKLEKSAPPDETIEVHVGERQMDPWIHVTIVRERRTMLWNDGWSLEETKEAGPYKYEKAFENAHPSVEEIAESIDRMLRVPENKSRHDDSAV